MIISDRKERTFYFFFKQFMSIIECKKIIITASILIINRY